MTDLEGVVPALAEALTKRNYSTLTPVQLDVLAPELADADLLVSAQTGSGKTVAFGLSLAPTLLQGADRFHHVDAPVALAVAPTRELALQVKRELEWLYGTTGASFASCVGGMDMRTERQVLGRGVHIVVGTPGRLRDHIERGSLDMTGLRAIVLDEADEMLDLGFREDLEFILDAAPPERRTLMFSATVPRTIATLAKRYQRNAVRLTTSSEQSQHVDIEYRALAVAPSDRENAIVNVLRYYEATSAIVFCSTRAAVNRITSRFANRGFSVVALSGELSQSERTHALQAMRDGRARVCIATDVAARGLDLPNLELVIHADIPENSQVLLHRSGRTGRAGRKGVSVVIVPHNQRKRTERLFQGAHIEAAWDRPPSADDIVERDDARLLEDPALGEPVGEAEKALVGEILARHSAEQIAAAFVRLYRAGQSAPEDLSDQAPPAGRDTRDNRDRGAGRERGDSRKATRDDFKDSVWFSLSVGHKQTAEPRWLLPMLYRVGNVAKGGIGAIKVYNSETHVEIEPGSVDRFVDAIGPDGTIEKGIVVTRMDGIPAPPNETRIRPSENRPYEKKKRSGDDRPAARGPSAGGRKETAARDETPVDRKPRQTFRETPRTDVHDKPAESPADKPRGTPRDEFRKKPGSKPWRKPGTKPGGKFGGRPDNRPEGKPRGPATDKSGAKKAFKPKFAKGGGKARGGAPGGFAARKRKNPD